MNVTTGRNGVPRGKASSATLLRRALRRHAAGVAVITVPGPAGFTATSFTSVSIEPALVSFYLGCGASTAPAVLGSTHFAVHILGAGQAETARRFALSGLDRFAGQPWSPSHEGLPILHGVPTWLSARTVLRQQIGDHVLVVGEVEDSGGHESGAGLVYHDGGYATTARMDPSPRHAP